MKELSIEEKAKAYDNALAHAKLLLKIIGNATLGNLVLKNEFEKMFLELAESEDERIRKAIYNALKYLERELSWDALGKVDILDAYDWLEKQGKKNPISNDLKNADKEFNNILKDKVSFETLKMLLGNWWQNAKTIIKEQKPAEWSEEDEKHLNSIIGDIKTDMGAYPRSKEVIDIYNDDISFLKSLKDRVQPQPKQEWSEEDEKLLNDAISLAHECDDLELGDWLKSLKYRCTWNV